MSPEQRRKTRRRQPARRRSAAPPAELTLDRAWPPFIEPGEVEALVNEVSTAAQDERERGAFLGVLRRAFEDTIELERLYADVLGVLGDVPEAAASFRAILSGVGRRAFDPGRIREMARHPLALKPIPDGEFGIPCKPELAVKPSVVFAIGFAADRVLGGDFERYAATLDTLAGLWEQTWPLENILRVASSFGPEERPARLRGLLRNFVRETGFRREFGSNETSGIGGFRPDIAHPEALPLTRSGAIGFGGGSGPSVLDQVPFGDPPGQWPPPRGPGFPVDFCDLIEGLCKGMVYGGLSKFQKVPVSTNADAITGLVPSVACAGQQVTILCQRHGAGFGATQPSDVEVLIGSTVAPVVSWSDTAIVITVPANATSGCVGFRNKTLEGQRFDAITSIQEGMAEISEGLHCLGTYQSGTWPALPVGPGKIPCTPFNFLRIGAPLVGWFAVNGAAAVTVTPGTNLTLSWSVTNATNIRIRRTGTGGPFVDQIVASSGTLAAGPFNGTQPTTATYELTATNPCGNVTRIVTVQLDQPPALGLVAIEVVQSIQRANNSVRLVNGKRAIARVWVSSGITNGFNKGGGPNQETITGRLTIAPSGSPTSTVNSGPPLNTGGTINARPPAAFDRNVFDDSLNFELPLAQLAGGRRLDVTVFVPGREGQPGYTATGSTTVTFLPQSTQEVLPFFCTDSALGGVPNAAQFATSIQGARTRLPIAQTGFVVNPSLAIATTSFENLTDPVGWGLLVTRLAMLIFVFPSTPVGGIRTAIVPNNATYALNGMALPRQLVTVPAMVARATLPATFAHEMSHLAGVDHAPCGGPPPPIDSRLPGTTESAGMDVPTRTVIPAGRGELMSLCGGQGRWPSIALYDGIMLGAFPI